MVWSTADCWALAFLRWGLPLFTQALTSQVSMMTTHLTLYSRPAHAPEVQGVHIRVTTDLLVRLLPSIYLLVPLNTESLSHGQVRL